jgi:hypothetical protein
LSLDAWVIIIGAIIGSTLAFVGGVVGEYLKVRMQNRKERNYIISNLEDELVEIIDIISKFNETFENSGTGTANKKYIIDLGNSMSLYTNHKDRLFLFKNKSLRREINVLYKDLKTLISESEGKVGTLANTPESKAQQKEIVQKYKDISTQAQTLKGKFKITKFFWNSGN